MKKLVAILLVAMMVLSFAACGEKEPVNPTSTYKTGLGVVTSMKGANLNVEEEKDATTQADVTSCAATFDADGKIVAISFDAIQSKASVNAEGVATVAEEIKTKKELGPDYNMVTYADPKAVGEWFEQVAALEEYCIGKTAAEVAAMPLGPNAHEHTDTPADADLMTKCTISVTDFINALNKAWENASNENATAAKTGLGVISTMKGENLNKAEEKDAKTQADVTSCAVALDAEGKIVAISFDTVQAKASVNAEGVVTVAEEIKTKKELGPDYNMATYADPKAVGEWFEQIAAFEAWCIGKTPADVAAMPLGPNAHEHTDTPADADLMTKCTISVTAFQNALAKAVANAK